MNFKIFIAFVLTFTVAFMIGRFSANPSSELQMNDLEYEITASEGAEIDAEIEATDKLNEIQENDYAIDDFSHLAPNKTSEIIEKLQQQNKALSKSYEQKEKRWQERYATALGQLNTAESKLRMQGIELEKISLEEAEEFLPQPFAGLISSSSGSTVESFKELQTQEQDYEWAILMQQQISDFFITHELASAATLQAVTCKATICEIRGFEAEEGAVSQVMSAMSAQPWWKFNSTHSSSSNSDEFGRYFYILAKKNV